MNELVERLKLTVNKNINISVDGSKQIVASRWQQTDGSKQMAATLDDWRQAAAGQFAEILPVYTLRTNLLV